MFPVNARDAGFIVVPKSHKTFTPEPKNKGDWIVVDQETFEPQAVKLLILVTVSLCGPIPRLVHYSGMTKINKNKKEIPERINRFTPYITFLPKSIRD